MTKLFDRNWFLATSDENIIVYVIVCLCGPIKYRAYVGVAGTKKNQSDVKDLL